MKSKKSLSAAEEEEIIKSLKNRFEKNISRHRGIEWKHVYEKLKSNRSALWSLYQMEDSGGEPDVIGLEKKSGAFVFYDCSDESPKGRRSLCYDRAALDSRKEHKPKDSAVEMASSMGIELLTEEEYRQLQTLGEFDLKTSSWIKTNEKVRKLGGALFCDRRFDTVFVYHNGAESYYGGRGWRGKILV